MASPTANHAHAMSGIKPPRSLVIGNDVAVNWKNWLQQFEWYATAVQLNEKPKEIQAATLMAAIGQEAIQIFNSFNLTEEEQKDITVIKAKYNKYFLPKINVSFERYNFFKAVQKENETFDEFLTVIRNLAKTCAFSTLHDDLLKDKIIFGIRSEQVREKLLIEEKLDLDKAITICKSSEQATKQLLELGQGESTNKVDRIKTAQKKEFLCKRCNTRHSKKNCLAFNKRCNQCNKKGHLEACCFTKKQTKRSDRNVDKVDWSQDGESSSENDSLYVNKIEEGSQLDWQETIRVNNQKFIVKLDTGAQCNVISNEIAKKIGAKIKPTNTKNLTSFSKHKLKVIGETVLNCKIKNITSEIKFKVINEEVPAILGNKSCQELGLILRINMINVNNNLYNGLGCIKFFEYDIDLIENPSFTILPPRKIPHAIRNDVKKELNQQELDR